MDRAHTIMKTRWTLALPFVLAACTGGDGGSPESSFAISDADPFGLVTGNVLDNVTGGQVAGATLEFDDDRTLRSDDSGAFRGDIDAGRRRVRVTAEGYLDWERDLPITGIGLDIEVRLTPRGTSMMVPSGEAATVRHGPASVDIPAGAFSGDMPVTVTYTDDTHPSALPGDFLFADESGVVRRQLARLDIDAEAQPSMPVSVSVPVPPDVSADEIALYALDHETGEWVEPVAPSGMDATAGVATFLLGHFSDHAVTIVKNTQGAASTLKGTVEVQRENGEWQVVTVATEIRAGDVIRTGRGSEVELLFPDGATRLLLRENSQFELDIGSDGPSLKLGLRSKLLLIARRLLRGRRFEIRGTAVCGVRGTVLSFSQRQCPEVPSYALMDMQVTEGEVSCSEHDVFAGKRLETCAPFKDAWGNSWDTSQDHAFEGMIPDGTGGEGGAGAVDGGATGGTGGNGGTSGGSCPPVSCDTYCEAARAELEDRCAFSMRVLSDWDMAGCFAYCACLTSNVPEAVACSVDESSCAACNDKSLVDAVRSSCGEVTLAMCSVGGSP